MIVAHRASNQAVYPDKWNSRCCSKRGTIFAHPRFKMKLTAIGDTLVKSLCHSLSSGTLKDRPAHYGEPMTIEANTIYVRQLPTLVTILRLPQVCIAPQAAFSGTWR